jgi:hypothetical protein
LRTEYEPERAAFSDKAHEAAKRLIYPLIFKTDMDHIEYHSSRVGNGGVDRILDGSMGIDLVVNVTVDGLMNPLIFTVQERYREIKYANRKLLTITEWNNSSNLPSELYKLYATLFVYGYYDKEEDRFVDAVCASVPDMILALSKKEISYSRQLNKKNQYYISVSFKELDRLNILQFWLKREGKQMSLFSMVSSSV